MAAYYNEFDPKAAAWLRQLIKNSNIAPGEVDERSITEVQPNDLKGFTQHHFFAGIGVWSYALRNAGWADDRPVCTASLPCQPFSAAGNQKGKTDERHLLPHFLELVKQCGFNTIFGEQVESAIKHGWLDDLQTVMEGEGYAVGHCVLGAHSVNAPHIRQRLYWVADTLNKRSKRRLSRGQDAERETINGHVGCDSSDSWVGDAEYDGRSTHPVERSISQSKTEGRVCKSERPGASEWLYCRDEKYRPIKSSLEPLVNGTAEGVVYSGDPGQQINPDYTAEARSMRLKGYGNAIVAPVAELFIRSFMEINKDGELCPE